MSELFENAIDSLRLGIRFYLDNSFETAHKHAILTIFHSIELLLKEKLYRVHPLFIYKNIDKPIGDDAYTVGLREIFTRYANLEIPLSKEERQILIELQKRRNRIEHHRYEPDESDFYVIGKSLRFIYHFLPDHLDCSLEDHVDEEMYRNIREVILEYEERLEEAIREVNKRTTPRSKDDLIEPTYDAICPQCGNETLVIGTEYGNFCFFCREEFAMAQCEWCLGYYSAGEINEFGMCDNCFSIRLDRW